MRNKSLLLACFCLVACQAHPKKFSSVENSQSLHQLPFITAIESRDRQQYEAFGDEFMISTQGVAATEAARQIFENGGNAIDAAIAASFAISVERPQSTGLGGGGFALIRFGATGEILAADFREQAPQKAHARMFLDQEGRVIEKKSRDGIFAVGVPGLVAGLEDLHRRFGSRPWAELVQPAIDLAREGFPVYPHLAEALQQRREILLQDLEAKAIFFNENGEPKTLGEVLIQKNLAQSLEQIQKNGASAFYENTIAAQILKTVQMHSGLISADDLKNYKVKYRAPVRGQFRDYEIVSMPPPSSGGVHILQILNMLENDPLREFGAGSALSIHLTASAMQSAFADRAKFLGDPDFVHIPVETLTSKVYAKNRRAQFTLDRARKAEEVRAGDLRANESDETTHFTIMDSEGNVVSSTQTINGFFGSGVMAQGTGIVLNNEMDDFSAKPGASNLFGAIGGQPNRIEAFKRPLSSMSPTIVLKDQRPVLALGTPAGTRILTCVAQSILNHLVYGEPLFEAMSLIRYHHQWQPDRISVESPGFSSVVTQQLKKMGYDLEEKDLGCKMQAVAFDGKRLHGVSDPRGEGRSFGR